MRPQRPAGGLPVGATVTRRTTGDTAQVLIRAGDKILGQVARLTGDMGALMSGTFTHRPAFTDLVDVFQRLERATAAGDTAAAAAARAEIDAAGVEVWHTVHEMRLDQPGSLVIAAGEVRFRPTDSFLMMRTGGLG
jgi:hypothetical protein